MEAGRQQHRLASALAAACALAAAGSAAAVEHPWRHSATEKLSERFAPPPGFARISVGRGSFAEFLRELPLRPGRPPVRDWRGRALPTEAHLAVVDLDVLPHQECADTAMRLRAEYLRSAGRETEIHFRFTSGHDVAWSRWQAGSRPRVRGNRVTWQPAARPDRSEESFRGYLTTLFLYAGSFSLNRELVPVKDARQLAIGDVFIQGGFPGHVVIVVDLAENPKTRERVFLLAQGFMPPQELHVLEGPDGKTGWYPVDFGDELKTPDWTFKKSDLKRFRD